jgi:hypothetical protein
VGATDQFLRTPDPYRVSPLRHRPWHIGLLRLEETAEGSGCLAKPTQDYRAVLRGRFSFGQRVRLGSGAAENA